MLDIFNIMSDMNNIAVPPSYREKIAWLSLAAMGVTLVPYLIAMAVNPPVAPLPDLGTMGLFAAAALAHAVVLGGGHLWLRGWSPEDAKAPPDERDRVISLRALGASYYVLIVGMILVGCVMPFNAGGWKIVNAAVAMIVLAQLVRYGVAAWCYRIGWHA